MAMNKKEVAELEAAKREVLIARALCWTPEPVGVDLPPPKFGELDTLGFTFNHYNGRISFGRSSSIGHATQDSGFPERTTTQRALSMYSTRLRALRALRCALERKFAEQLAGIDAQIAVERAK